MANQTDDIRKNLRIVMDNEPWLIADAQFVKPGKGNAFVRCRVKNLLTGRVIDRTWKSGEKVELAEVEEKQMQALYSSGSGWCFMDNKSFEQAEISKENLGDTAQWIMEGTVCSLVFWNGNPITVTPPKFMTLKITKAEPAVKGNTANRVMKEAFVETGAKVMVPIFVDAGEKIRVDTDTGEYLERVND
jgi:elongation factor P